MSCDAIVAKPGPIGRDLSQGGGFKEAVELIAGGEDIDYEGAAGVIEFNADRDNVRGAVEIWYVDPQARALVTAQTLIVDLGAGQAPPPAVEEVTRSPFVVPVTLTLSAGSKSSKTTHPGISRWSEGEASPGPTLTCRFCHRPRYSMASPCLATLWLGWKAKKAWRWSKRPEM